MYNTCQFIRTFIKVHYLHYLLHNILALKIHIDCSILRAVDNTEASWYTKYKLQPCTNIISYTRNWIKLQRYL